MDVLGVRGLPFLSRRNYYYEFLHLIPWGLLAGMVEGNAASIVVAKTFRGSDFLVAAASAMPIGALLFSSIWGVLCAGRRKLRLATVFGSGTALCAATVCLTRQTPSGGVLFVIQMGAAQVFLSGVVTVRSSLWKHNYPPEGRGRIAARLQAVRLMMSVLVVVAASSLFDYDAGLYRLVYPAVAVAGLVAMVILQGVHVRHEKAELGESGGAGVAVGVGSPGSSVRGEAGRAGDGTGIRGVRRVSVRESLSPLFLFGGMVDIVRTDRRYARYLAAQMVFGASVQAVIPVLVVVIKEASKMYLVIALLIELIPKLVMFSSLRRWGRLFDRVGVNRFRVFTGSCAAAGLVCGMVATVLLVHRPESGSEAVTWAALALFGVRAVFHGLHQGGGTLAWNLGHLHYASRQEAERYMALHQTMTGLRGLVTPFVGIALWRWLGWGVWVISIVLCLVGVAGFHRLAREESADRRSV